MRLLVASLLLCLSPLAAADDFVPAPMPSYTRYMQKCTAAEMEDNMELRAMNHGRGQIYASARCQCQFENLPKPGRDVPFEDFDRAMTTCEAEDRADAVKFTEKYVGHINKRNGKR